MSSLFKKPYAKMSVAELRIEEGKTMQKIEDKEKELKELNFELEEIRQNIRDKQN